MLALVAAGCARPPVARSTAKELPSILQRQDTPPPGVPGRSEVGFHGLGLWVPCPSRGLSCINGVCSSPTRFRVSVRGKQGVVLQPIQICLQGVGLDPVSLIVSPPRGRSRREQVLPDDEGSVEKLVLLPPGPPGIYSVNVVQGSIRLSTTVEVRDVTRPRLLLHPATTPPGSQVHLALAGVKPRQEVAIHLYGPVPLESDDPDAAYITTLRLTTNAFGQAEARLQTHPSDRLGYYFFVSGTLSAQLALARED